MQHFTGTHTIANVQRDFVEWHRGRTPYVFWGLALDRLSVDALLVPAAAWLADLLHSDYPRQPHITLDICGFPAGLAAAEPEDEFAPALLGAQLSELSIAAPPSFALAIGALDSFSSAPFLTVNDLERGIAGLRACLAVDGRHRLLGDYVPHVTVGLYRDAWPRPIVAERLAGFPVPAPVRVDIERLSLLTYAPAEIGGELTCAGYFDLLTRRMVWTDARPAFANILPETD